MRSSRGSTTTSTTLPLSFIDTVCLVAMLLSLSCFNGPRASVQCAMRAGADLAGHHGFVFRVTPLIGRRIANRHRKLSCVGKVRVGQRFTAAERIFRVARRERSRTDIRERDRHL